VPEIRQEGSAMNDVVSEGEGHRLLLAEDNPLAQKVMLRMLGRLGYECDLAENGREAVEAVASRAYDLVLMDCEMPEMNGIEATGRIRAAEAGTRRTPIVAMSARALPGDEERFLAAGMDACIMKPASAASLGAFLAGWFRGEQGIDVTALSEAVENAEPIDRARFQEISGGNPNLERELAQLFLDDTRRRVAQLLEAMNDGLLDDVRRAAHAIKGASANIGAHAFQSAAAQLEDAAAGADESRTAACWDAFRAEFRRLEVFLHEATASS
jgi:CheY-like chemotaxis protein